MNRIFTYVDDKKMYLRLDKGFKLVENSMDALHCMPFMAESFREMAEKDFKTLFFIEDQAGNATKVLEITDEDREAATKVVEDITELKKSINES